MTKGTFFFFCLCFLNGSLLGQSSNFQEALTSAHLGRANRDSALYLAQRAYTIAETDGEKENINRAFVYIGMALYNRNQADTAKIILTEAVSELGPSLLENGMGRWYLAKYYQRKAMYPMAKEEYLLAKEIFQRHDSILLVSNALNGIGATEGMQGNYSEALDWFIQSYENKLANGLEHKTDVESHNIANVYMRQGSYDKAIDYFRKSMQLKDGYNDHSPYLGVGGAYNLQGQIDSALYYYKLGYEMAVDDGAMRGQVTAAINLSNVYFQKKQYPLAIQYLKKALSSPAIEARNIPSIYSELGKNYMGLNRLDSARYFLELGLKESFAVTNRQYMAEASEFLSLVLAKLGEFEDAYEYASLSIIYTDSINLEKRNDAITDQRIKLETLKKQHEIDTLNRENLIQQYKYLSIIIAGIGLGVIALLSFFNFRSRARLKHQKLEEEKSALKLELDKKMAQLSAHTLHMIHHKNGLEEIEQHLSGLEGDGKRKIKNVIAINKAQEKDWENFNTYFSEVHAHFFDILHSNHADLTQSEVRLSALIRMNLANNEIATLLNIEPKSVKMARYRLKKKLGLEEDQDLNAYIQRMELSASSVN